MRYIKLSEKILNWEWFTDGNMLKVWIFLLVNAQQFEDGRHRGVALKTGQLITGRKQISKETGLSEQQVRTCLNRLKSTNEITIETTNQYSIITILKYDLYQSNDPYYDQQINQDDNQRITNEQPTDNQQITTSKILRNEDIKNTRKEIYKEKKFVRPTVEEVQAYCEERNNTVDPQYFVDFYTANGWKVGKNSMKDWKATVRYWERNNYSSPKQKGDVWFE